ncbi:MAG: OadG-related small transporter subunit [Thermodesulfobacteriota bacterium]
MENLDFGLNMAVVGMGGTLGILFILTLLIDALNKIFAAAQKKKEDEK